MLGPTRPANGSLVGCHSLKEHGRLFQGHGLASPEPWFVQVIEPNLAGATAIAEHWHDLLASSR